MNHSKYAIAASETVRRSLDYTSVARKLLCTNEGPLLDGNGNICDFPDPEREYAYGDAVSADCHELLVSSGQDRIQIIPHIIEESKSVSSEPIDHKMFYTLDRELTKVVRSMERQETRLVVDRLLNIAVAKQKTVVLTDRSNYRDAFRRAFQMLEEDGNRVVKIAVHTSEMAYLREWGFFESSTSRDVFTENLFGHIWHADVHATTEMDKNWILLMAAPDEVGYFHIVDNPKVKLQVGHKIEVSCFEKIGVGIYTDKCVAIHCLTN